MDDHSFATLFDLLPIGAYRSHPDGRQLRANPALVRLNGYDTEAQMLAAVTDIGDSWYVDPGRRNQFVALMERDGKVRDFVSQVRRHRTREMIWIRENAHCVRDEAGTILFYEGTVEDITADRTRATTMQIALDSMSEGFALIGPDGRTLVSNRRHRQLLNLPDELMEGQPTQSELVQLQIERGDFGPDMRYEEAVARGYVALEGTGPAGDAPQLYQRRTTDGRTLEVRTARLPDGGAVRTFNDITAHMAVQDALQVVLDNAGRGIVMVDAGQRIVFHNRAFATLLDLESAWLDQHPTMGELLGAMRARGDFAEPDEPAPVELAHLPLHPPVPPDGSLPVRYLRRTRAGRVLEVNSQPLADGASVRTYSDVTDYVLAERTLARTQRELAMALDAIDQGLLIIDGSGRAVLSNRRHRELLDLPDDWMERFPRVEDLVRLQRERGDFGQNLERINPEAREWISQYPDRSGPEMPACYWRTTPDGRTLEVRSKRQIDGGVVRTFTDITDSVRARERLEHSHLRLTTLINTLPDRVWLKDTQGVYQLANYRFCLHVRRNEADIIGRTAAELFPAAMVERFARQDRAVLESRHPMTFEEVQPSRRTGLPLHFEVVKVAMRDAAGRAVGVLGVSREITERKRAEAALRAARDAAEAGARAKAQFLANMSHEIRTPMNAVIGMSDLLAETRLDDEQKDFVQTIRSSGGQLLTLINDILDFSKIDGGHLELESLPVDLTDCIEGALDLLSAAAAEKALTLYYRIDPALPAQVLGDPVRLRQILVNLVANAVKFTVDGEIELSARQVAGTQDPNRLWLQFDVRDTGIGIPADRMDRLFQVFSQIDMSTTRQYGGTGLGLAICQRLAQLMGGTIGVRSAPGEGSVFSVQIPLRAVPIAATLPPADHSVLAGKRVLLIDDHAGHAAHLVALLERSSIRSTVRIAAHEIAHQVENGLDSDLVIVDASLDPPPDAPSIAHWLRRHPRSQSWPIVLLSQPGHRLDLNPLAPCRAIRRPVKARALVEALQDLAAAAPRPSECADPPAHVGAPVAGEPDPAQGTRRPLRILLAEDNPVSLRVTRYILDRLGHPVTLAGTGKQAVAAVQAAAQAGAPFDVVLMDAHMPDTDGLAATRAMRVLLTATEQPWIIALTAGGPQGDRDACLAAGMDDYLSKPMRPDDLANALARARRRGPDGR